MAKGFSVEVLSEGEWWDATVAKVKEEKIRVHYVGGNDEEDEWVPLNRCAQRRPSSEHKRAWRGTLPASRTHVRRTAPYASLHGLVSACVRVRVRLCLSDSFSLSVFARRTGFGV